MTSCESSEDSVRRGWGWDGKEIAAILKVLEGGAPPVRALRIRQTKKRNIRRNRRRKKEGEEEGETTSSESPEDSVRASPSANAVIIEPITCRPLPVSVSLHNAVFKRRAS